MEWLVITLVALFGLMVGSFLNAFDYSLKSKKPIIKRRSECPKCKHKLKTIDLIPVFSYLFQQGNCRYCKKPISVQYPVVEIITAFIFAAIFWLLFLTSGSLNLAVVSYTQVIQLLFLFFAVSALILIVIADLREMIIPDEIVIPAIYVSLAFAFIFPFLSGMPPTEAITKFFYYLLAAVIGSGFFYSMILISKGKWMGGGDVKLAILMGLVLGWPLILLALFVSFISGSIFGVSLIIANKKKFADTIPFGPFLVLGTLFALFWGETVLKWYLGYLGLGY